MTISRNLEEIRSRIAGAAQNAGRKPEEIKLVAVSKLFPPDAIIEAFSAGQLVFGENYIQEVQAKRAIVPPEVIFHFIGHLQSNKTKIAAAACAMIETIDSHRLAKSLNNHLNTLQRTIDVLVQVNVAKESQKSGIPENEAEELLTQLKDLPRIRVCGLMTIPPFEADPELSRPHFRRLRLLSEQLAAKQMFAEGRMPELSMGMSNDFGIAIEEGATIVRIGTAIFGERVAAKK